MTVSFVICLEEYTRVLRYIKFIKLSIYLAEIMISMVRKIVIE